MIDALQVTINGLLVGLVYGLVAVSFVVIYRSSRIVNLAQGEILLLGALFIWTFTLGVKLPWGIGVPVALVCCVGMALILERALFRPLIGELPFTVFMASIALLILLRGVAQLVWGAETRPFPQILPSGAWSIGPFLVTKRLLIGAVLTASLVELLHWFFMHTRQGLRLAAVAEDHYTALSLGVSVRQAVAVAWIMGAVLSAIGSVVLLSDQIVSLNAAGIGLRALPIALLGGMESVRGALLAGAIIGVGEALASVYVDPFTKGVSSQILPYVIMIGVLLFRPQGLFGWKVIERLCLPTGIRFESFATEGRYIHTWPQAMWFAALLLALVLIPHVVNLYVTGVLTVMFITLMAVYGLQVTVGMAGQINVAQSAFMGVGAYAAARLSENVPFWLAIPGGGLAAALVSIVFALPAIRVKGFYLALTTLAAQVMFPIIVLALPSNWLGGTSGMAVEPIEIGGRMLSTPLDMYYFTLAGVLICSVGAFNLRRSRFGRALCAVRDNELAAEVTGVNVSYYKVMAFFAGSLFAGVAGGFFAYYIRYVTTENFNLLLSIWYLGMLIVGGLSSPLGAILGTVFVTAIQEVFHAFGGALLTAFPNLGGGLVFATSNVILGICILLALIFESRGLAHRWSVLKAAYRIWPFPHS